MYYLPEKSRSFSVTQKFNILTEKIFDLQKCFSLLICLIFLNHLLQSADCFLKLSQWIFAEHKNLHFFLPCSPLFFSFSTLLWRPWNSKLILDLWIFSNLVGSSGEKLVATTAVVWRRIRSPVGNSKPFSIFLDNSKSNGYGILLWSFMIDLPYTYRK